MKYQPEEIAIVMGSAKSAAVYFEHVVPYIIHEDNETLEFITSIPALLPPGVDPALAFMAATELQAHHFRSLHKKINSFPKLVAKYLETNSFDPESCTFDELSAYTACIVLLKRNLEGRGDEISSKLLLAIGDRPTAIVSDMAEYRDLETGQGIGLQLTGLRLVDTGKLSWQHIIELRKDEASRQRLRRLRTFVFEEFDGKPASFVEDKLHVALEDYEHSAKKWGLDTVLASLDVGGIERIVAAGTAGFCSAAFGAPIATTAMVGAGVYFAGVGVSIARASREMSLKRITCPVSYFIDIETKLNESQLIAASMKE